MIFSKDDVSHIKEYQDKDVLEDIVDLKNQTAIDNMKLKNLISIDEHLKSQLTKLNYNQSRTKGLSRRSVASRTNKQSDSASNIFSSFSKDNDDNYKRKQTKDKTQVAAD